MAAFRSPVVADRITDRVGEVVNSQAFRSPEGADHSLVVVDCPMEAFRSPEGADHSLVVVDSPMEAFRSPEGFNRSPEGFNRSPEEAALVATIPTAAVMIP